MKNKVCERDFEKMLKNMGLLTINGCFDPSKLLIDPLLKGIIENINKKNEEGMFEEESSSLKTLNLMVNHGRVEAGIFLMGFLDYLNENDIKNRQKVVEALSGFNNKACAKLLCRELERVNSVILNKGYSKVILDVLSNMPKNMVENAADDVISDRSLKTKIKKIFNEQKS